jgi:predicted flap endonuclease-1-like 5' DNA nuclease
MMHLIAQLSGWLLLAAGFAGLAGWAFAALRGLPVEASLRRERDGLMRDLRAISAENAGLNGGLSPESEREMDTLRRRADLDAARIAEMARALAGARDRAQEAQGRVAELERAAERHQTELADLSRTNEDAARVAEPVVATPVVPPEPALQDWRLRYFEQRVRYLENQERESVAVPPPTPEPDVADTTTDPTWEWRARTAEARAAHAEEELRAAQLPQVSEVKSLATAETEEGPFAANAEADMLLRWRMLYLEKRVAYLQGEQHAEARQDLIAAMDSEEGEKWKWRARYLEARTRHLEQRLAETPAPPAATPQAAETPVAEEAVAPAPEPAPVQLSVPTERPPKLAAPQGGLPDDFTLIDGVSGIQQTTLNSLGIFHFEQIAAWTPAHVAWIDKYLRLRGRIAEQEWVEQAQELAEHGVVRRVSEEEEA